MAEKESIGFPTPSKEWSDAFTKAKDLLSKKKTDWQEIQTIFSALLSFAISGKTNLKSIDTTAAQGLLTVVNLLAITQLGIELTETHERLAKVEKLINDIKG